MAWLLLAVSLMLLLKEEIVIYNAEDPSIEYSIWKLMTLPYTLDMRPRPSSPKTQPVLPKNTKAPSAPARPAADTIQAATCSVDVIQLDGIEAKKTPISRTETYVYYGEYCITVRITMPSNFGLRSWRTLETFIEVIAVGIYLYATFVLMSTLFFNSDRAMIFAAIMGFCLSFVRI